LPNLSIHLLRVGAGLPPSLRLQIVSPAKPPTGDGWLHEISPLSAGGVDSTILGITTPSPRATGLEPGRPSEKKSAATR
jgi:hypothetical protein